MRAARAAGAVRTALLGYGLAGSAFHAPFLATTAGLELTTVVTRDPERAAAARRRYPGVRILPRAADVWRAADAHDLVVVATPNRTHVPLALEAVAAGLPVVVDKPVAPTAADARRLREAAAERGVPLAVYQNRRWDGDALTLRKLLAEGALGRVHRFESRFERWRPHVRADSWREGPDPADAGGLLLDLGSHLVDQALAFFGPVTGVYAELAALRPGAAVEDDAFVALEHASGVRSHLWASALAGDLGPRFRVLGTAGAYVKHGLDVQEAALRAGAVPGGPGWGEEPESAWGRLGVPGDARPVRTEPGAYQEFYAAMRDAVLGRGPVPVPIDEALAALVVLEAARISARDGRTIRC